MSAAPALPGVVTDMSPPPPASGAPPGAPPGAQPFGSALEHEMARTAQAEGQKRSPGEDSRERGHARPPHVRREDEAVTGLAVPSAATAVQATSTGDAPSPAEGEAAAPIAPDSGTAAAVAVPAPATAVQAQAPSVASAQAEVLATNPAPAESPEAAADQQAAASPEPTNGPAAPQGEESAVPVAQVPAERQSAREPSSQSRPGGDAGLDVMAKSHGEPARGAGEALPAKDDAPAAEGSPSSALAPRERAGEATPSAAPQQGRETEIGVQAQGARTAAPADGTSSGQSEGDERRPEKHAASVAGRATTIAGRAKGASTSVASARSSAAEPASPGLPASGSAATGTQDGAAVSAPAAPSAPAAAANAPQLTVRAQLGEMIDAIQTTIELASRRGATQARIALQPEELGEIRIHLSQSADGIVARLTAATPAAAQALAAGRGELHQSLSSLGATLLQLDIGTFEGRDRTRQEAAGEAAGGRAAAPAEEDDSIAPAEGASPVVAPSRGATGALVDVLA
jgi:flagellar hook-length control protein FliK